MTSTGLLAGVRVLDFTIWRPGPYATQLLGELGADIIKVEPPGGDPMRAYPGLFRTLSANKRSIVLDLKTDEGKQRARKLAAESDVVTEGYRPGVAARLGIGFDDVHAVNPRIIYCSISGMGQTGALSSAPGHDLNFQAWGGVLAPEGSEPVTAAVPIADLGGGLAAAYAICAALVRQQRTGEGERIDVAMGDLLATWTGAVPPHARGVDPDARGVPGYGMFRCRDGYVALGIITEDHFWRALCDALAMRDVRDLEWLERMRRTPELQARITAAIEPRERDELARELLAAGVPASPVLDRAGMMQLPHFAERGIVTHDPSRAPATGHPVRFVEHPAARTTAAPEIDEHRGAEFRPRPPV